MIGGLFLALLTLAGCDRMASEPLIDLDGRRVAATRAQPSSPGEGAGGADAGNRNGDTAPEAESQVPLPEAEIYPGSGRFTGAATGRTQVETGEGGFTLNFAEADVREVVDAVIGGALGENYAVDPKVEGTITARTAKPLTREQVIPALEDVLAMNGAALVMDQGIYRVVPLQQAAGVAPVLAGTQQGARTFALHIIPVTYAPARELQETLQSFVAPGRSLQADAKRNLLLFRGPGSEAQDLVSMVELFDVDWMAGMSFALLPLENAQAQDVVVELNEVFGGGQRPGPSGEVIRFLPISRMNAVLVISAQPDYLSTARNWVDRLDRGGAEDERQLFVYKVQNSRAQDLANVLGEVFQVTTVNAGARGGEVAPGLQAARVSGDTGGLGPDLGGTNDNAGSGSGANGSTSGGGTANPGGNGDSGGFAASRRGAGSGRGFGGGSGFGGTSGGGDGEGPRIIADGRNNALLIKATAREYRMIENTLKKLDVVPLQVLIEATIAEVSLTDDLRFGVRWFLQGEAEGTGSGSVTFSDAANGAVAQTFPGFSFLFEGADVRAALNALSSVTNVNVVSSPQLMVLDNETARLNVGDQVPVATQSAVSTDDLDSPIVNSIEFRDTGVILEITPRVSNSGLVVLDVNQEVSDVTETTTSAINSPTIQQRSISSSVAIQTGETIALGGLIRDSREDAVSGVPLLKDLPGIGHLFKTTDRTADRTELLVLITPRVVRDPAQARAVTLELRQRLHGIEDLQRRVGRGFGSSAPDAQTPAGAPTATPDDGAGATPPAKPGQDDEPKPGQKPLESGSSSGTPKPAPVKPVETEAGSGG